MQLRQPLKIIVFYFLFCQGAVAQFGIVKVTFDDRLLKANDRQILFPLQAEISRFFTTTVWDEDYSDLEIPLQIQVIFEGSSTKGAAKTYLVQALFSSGSDQRYFDKGLQFVYNDGMALFYDPVIFDPLASFLAFYGNLILAREIDTYESRGGTGHYETSRTIALRGDASDYPRGWANRIQLVDDISSNYGLRKARFAFYYALDLFKDGEVEEAINQFNEFIKGLDEVHDHSPRDHYTVLFLQAHAEELTAVLQILRQPQILRDLIELDPDNEPIYRQGLETISR